MQFSVELKNFPDWAVPMTHIVPTVRSNNDAIDINDINVGYDFFYTWTKINQLDYRVDINLDPNIISDDDIVLVVDLDLVFLNERNYYVDQTEGI